MDERRAERLIEDDRIDPLYRIIYWWPKLKKYEQKSKFNHSLEYLVRARSGTISVCVYKINLANIGVCHSLLSDTRCLLSLFGISIVLTEDLRWHEHSYICVCKPKKQLI